MLKMLIADDEKIVLNGLENLLPWEDLGISVCATASDGQEALTKILEYQPDIVLIDISMPTFSGLEVIKLTRKMHFNGHFIILSGYTKFEYAQQAMKYNVNYYLSKPIDSDNLLMILKELINKELASKKSQVKLNFLEKNQRQQIIQGLLTGDYKIPTSTIEQFKLNQGPYQVVISKQSTLSKKDKKFSFANLLDVNNSSYAYFEEIEIEDSQVILLKNRSIQLLTDLEDYHYETLTNLKYFVARGKVVPHISETAESYSEAKMVLDNRFYFPRTTYVATIHDVHIKKTVTEITEKDYQLLKDNIINCILLKKSFEIDGLILTLENQLTFSKTPIKEIRYALIDFYLAVKHQISNKFPDEKMPILNNPEIIYFVNTKENLAAVLHLLKEQFHIMANCIGIVSNKTTIDGVTFYIQQNYRENLTLEQLADIFNYNPSYLGKLFTKSVGTNFNHYLDQVRITKAKQLLADPHLKIYEVAAQVGYKNVDYFYKKFRLLEDKSPAKYRNQLTPKP